MDSLNQAAQLSGMLFGAAAGPPTLTDPAYQALYLAHCGSITSDIALKWNTIRRNPDFVPDYSQGDALMAFCNANNIQLKGHNLCWNEANPTWMWKDDETGPDFGTLQITQADAETKFEQHITETVTRYKGQIRVWDVVNEPIEPAHGRPDFMRSKLWMKVYGPDYVERALRLASAADPNAKLFINQQGLDWTANTNHRLGLLRLIDRLQAHNCPLHGIGLESHLTLWATVAHEGTLWLCGELQKRGLEIHISELDCSAIGGSGDALPSGTDAATVDSTIGLQIRSYLADVLSFPNVTQVITWELSDKYSDLVKNGQVNPLPFAADMSDKPFSREMLAAFQRRKR